MNHRQKELDQIKASEKPSEAVRVAQERAREMIKLNGAKK